MRILALIPARGGSKGVPGKNIKLLNGKPLLAYTAEVALQCCCFSDVILSTEDAAIADVGKQYGLNVPFMRPEELADDSAPTIDAIVHALEYFKSINVFYDAVCLLQVTSPFRTLAFLEDAVHKFTKSNCDALISVQRVPHEYNPHWTFEPTSDGNLRIATGEKNIIPRRQELPLAYHRDGSIYITKTKTLLEQRSLFGETLTYIESAADFRVNIDTEADWAKAEKMAIEIAGSSF